MNSLYLKIIKYICDIFKYIKFFIFVFKFHQELFFILGCSKLKKMIFVFNFVNVELMLSSKYQMTLKVIIPKYVIFSPFLISLQHDEVKVEFLIFLHGNKIAHNKNIIINVELEYYCFLHSSIFLKSIHTFIFQLNAVKKLNIVEKKIEWLKKIVKTNFFHKIMRENLNSFVFSTLKNHKTTGNEFKFWNSI